jgi:DNA invertase Pin-like site-specific DNA recombinase
MRTKSGKMVGYARVSTHDQDVELQLAELRAVGCAKRDIHVDTASGSKASRPGLEKCLQSLTAGDTLIVWRVDRLGRSLAHLVQVVNGLREKGVAFKSLRDGAIDTTTASGDLIFNIFCSLAQFERRLIQERTRAGLSVARARGRLGGRPAIPAGDPRVQTAKRMYLEKAMAVPDICKTLRISRPTFYRYIAIS